MKKPGLLLTLSLCLFILNMLPAAAAPGDADNEAYFAEEEARFVMEDEEVPGEAISDDAASDNAVPQSEVSGDEVLDNLGSLNGASDNAAEKKKVYLRYVAPEGFTIDSKQADKDGRYIVSEDEMGYFVLSPGEDGSNAAAAEESISADQVVNGNLSYELAGMEPEEDGWLTLPIEAEFTDSFLNQYEILGGIFGNAYTLKPRYYVSFSAENDGKQGIVTIEIPKGTTDVKVKDFLQREGRLGDVVPTMGGIVDGSEASIISWNVRENGNAVALGFEEFVPIDKDFGYTTWAYDEEIYDSTEEYVYYTLSYGTDYYLEAMVAKNAAEHLYVQSIPAVCYSDAAHICYGQRSSASKTADLLVEVYGNMGEAGTYEDEYHPLNSSEYSITYKNNKAVSMRLDAEGRYVPIYTDDAKRPQVIIKGKGKYNGFSAKMYFDILPADIVYASYPYSYDYYQEFISLTGLKRSYALNAKGKIGSRIKPKASKLYGYYDSKWNYKQKKVTLKAGTDYEEALYRWNDSCWEQQGFSDPSLIETAGDYLYVLRGIGNYCGSAYGDYIGGDFDDGSMSGDAVPSHFSFAGTESLNTWQFRVSNGDAYWDLANAVVNIKRPIIKYDGKYHGKEDFGLSLMIGKGSDRRELREGIDYNLTLTSDRYPQEYTEDGETWVGISRGQDIAETNGSDSPARIYISNNYSISIDAVEGGEYYGTISPKKKLRISGVVLKPAHFECGVGRNFAKSAAFTGSNFETRYSLTKTATKNKLTTSYGNYRVQAYSHKSKAAPGSYTVTLYAVGAGVDHSSTATKTALNIKGASLQSIVDRGWLTFSLSEGEYNVKGAYPTVTMRYRSYDRSSNSFTMSSRSFTPTSNKYKIYVGIAVGSASASHLNSTVNTLLTFNFSSNMKAGGTAVMTVKAGGKNGFTGTVKKNYGGERMTYTIAPCVVDYAIPLLKDTTALSYGKLYAVIHDESATKGKLEKPKLTLYQACYNNGWLTTVPLKSKQYAVSGIRVNDYTADIRIGSGGDALISGFNFGDGVSVNGQYHVYDAQAKISSAHVVYKGQEYDIDAKNIPVFPFEGVQLRFDRRSGDGVKSLTLSDGTVLGPDDFDVAYGANTAAGRKSGSFTIQLKYNDSSATWKYNGKATFFFDISGKDEIVV